VGLTSAQKHRISHTRLKGNRAGNEFFFSLLVNQDFFVLECTAHQFALVLRHLNKRRREECDAAGAADVPANILLSSPSFLPSCSWSSCCRWFGVRLHNHSKRTLLDFYSSTLLLFSLLKPHFHVHLHTQGNHASCPLHLPCALPQCGRYQLRDALRLTASPPVAGATRRATRDAGTTAAGSR
jgi:hypothetical protein